jgi:hypothetical protein
MAFKRLTVDLLEGSDPIAGEVSADGQPPRPFAGYIKLIQELERARPQRPALTPSAARERV